MSEEKTIETVNLDDKRMILEDIKLSMHEGIDVRHLMLDTNFSFPKVCFILSALTRDKKIKMKYKVVRKSTNKVRQFYYTSYYFLDVVSN